MMIIAMNPPKEEYLFATYLCLVQRVTGSLALPLVSRAKGYEGGNYLSRWWKALTPAMALFLTCSCFLSLLL